MRREKLPTPSNNKNNEQSARPKTEMIAFRSDKDIIAYIDEKCSEYEERYGTNPGRSEMIRRLLGFMKMLDEQPLEKILNHDLIDFYPLDVLPISEEDLKRSSGGKLLTTLDSIDQRLERIEEKID